MEDIKFPVILADSKEESELLSRCVLVKDELLKLTPGYREDADEFLAALRPHTMGPEAWANLTESEREQAELDNESNNELARRLAQKWYLPLVFLRDPVMFAERPFSGFTVSRGTAGAILPRNHMWKGLLPTFELRIDVRLPKDVLLRQLDDYIDRAKSVWRERGGWEVVHPGREIDKYEAMVAVRKLRDAGLTQEKVAAEIGKTVRHVQRLEDELSKFLKDKRYWEIAPHTHAAWIPLWDGAPRLCVAPWGPEEVSRHQSFDEVPDRP